MPDEDSFPESDDPNTNPWLTDKVVSSIQGPDVTSGRDREVVQTNRDEAYLRLHSVSVYVRDLERSIRFFVDQLGFRLLSDVRFASGYRWVEITPPDGTASLTLVLPGREKDDERFVGQLGAVTFLTEDVE